MKMCDTLTCFNNYYIFIRKWYVGFRVLQKSLKCSTTDLPSGYFKFTNFLIAKVLFCAIFLWYIFSMFFHRVWAFVFVATWWNTLRSTHCLIRLTAFRWDFFQSSSGTLSGFVSPCSKVYLAFLASKWSSL